MNFVRRLTQSEPTPDVLSTYLSSAEDRHTQKLFYTYSSLWSGVRQACRRLKVTFYYSEANEVAIAADESERITSKNITTFLHRLVQSRFGDDLIPLNVNKRRYSNTDPTCPSCVQPETLPHVVYHCRPHMVQIRERHDSVVKRLSNAIRFGKITTDRTVEQSNIRLRPDVVVEEDNS